MKHLSLGNVRHFVIDECDKVLDTVGETLIKVLVRACDVGSVDCLFIRKQLVAGS